MPPSGAICSFAYKFGVSSETLRKSAAARDGPSAGDLAGRVALVVWGPRWRKPWLGIVLDAVSAELGAPIPPPGVPGPFSLEDAGRLARLLSDAGLADVTVGELPVPLRAASFEQWWSRTTSLAGPLAKRLAWLPEDAAQRVRASAREAVGPYQTPSGLEFPGVALLAAARRV